MRNVVTSRAENAESRLAASGVSSGAPLGGGSTSAAACGGAICGAGRKRASRTGIPYCRLRVWHRSRTVPAVLNQHGLVPPVHTSAHAAVRFAARAAYVTRWSGLIAVAVAAPRALASSTARADM